MRVKVKINAAFEELEIHICNKEMNEEVAGIAEDIKNMFEKTMMVTDEKGNKCPIVQGTVERVFAQNQKVLIVCDGKEYYTNRKLYELEEELDKDVFIRISKSEIINMNKIKMVDMNVMGTMKVILCGGTECYASRRNITRLKKALEITKGGRV